MTPEADLEPGERVLASWSARVPGRGSARAVTGTLRLTNHRLVFAEKSGLLGRSRSPTTSLSVPLEGIGGAAPHRSEMRIGYGDRMVIEGIEIAGLTYELGREVSSRAVLERIASARELRRTELGLAHDLETCRSCGRWIAKGAAVCSSCARAPGANR
jgi:hypothetical protein